LKRSFRKLVRSSKVILILTDRFLLLLIDFPRGIIGSEPTAFASSEGTFEMSVFVGMGGRFAHRKTFEFRS